MDGRRGEEELAGASKCPQAGHRLRVGAGIR